MNPTQAGQSGVVGPCCLSVNVKELDIITIFSQQKKRHCVTLESSKLWLQFTLKADWKNLDLDVFTKYYGLGNVDWLSPLIYSITPIFSNWTHTHTHSLRSILDLSENKSGLEYKHTCQIIMRSGVAHICFKKKMRIEKYTLKNQYYILRRKKK